jgi:hypothetical protein
MTTTNDIGLDGRHVEEVHPMIETGAYGERIFTPYRASNPCEAGFRQIRISRNETSRTGWLLRSD